MLARIQVHVRRTSERPEKDDEAWLTALGRVDCEPHPSWILFEEDPTTPYNFVRAVLNWRSVPDRFSSPS